MQEKIERIDVVIERLLEIDAVGANLPRGLAHQSFPSFISPTRGVRYLRIKGTDKKERKRFSKKMGVGREISREKALDISAVECQRGQKFGTEFRSCGIAREQLVYPYPRQAAKRDFQRAAP